jgi:NADH:ubiquinone oxidoreductase subunit 2 (subunit N)
VLDRPPKRLERRTSSSPLTTALAVSAAGTVAFGVVAEPLLRLAERATMLGA